MITVNITPEDYTLAELLSSVEMISAKFLPKTYKAVKAAAKLIMYTWKTYALGAPIPNSPYRLKRATGEYGKSIKMRMLSPLSWYIYSDSPVASYLEDGTKSYDMKKTHPYGPRSRVVKKTVRDKSGRVLRQAGDPYLIIPFRHGSINTATFIEMPNQLYNKIKQELKVGNMQLSQMLKSQKTTPNYDGELVPRRQYRWGSRLTGTGVDKLEGMVMFPQFGTGGKGTMFFTFRVISATNSAAFKWIQKARPAMNISSHVVENTKDIIREMVSEGLKEDLGLPE